MSEKKNPFETKLDKDTKSYIFRAYVRATPEERYHFAQTAAEKYGVSRKTIQRIIRDKKRLNAYIEDKQRAFDLESAKMLEHLGEAVDVHIDIIRDAANYPHMYKGTVQASANALMDRLGFKPKKDAEDAMVIKFAVDPQMPKRSESEADA